MIIKNIFSTVEAYLIASTVAQKKHFSYLDLVKEVESYLGFRIFANEKTAQNYFYQWKAGKKKALDKLIIFYIYAKTQTAIHDSGKSV